MVRTRTGMRGATVAVPAGDAGPAAADVAGATSALSALPVTATDDTPDVTISRLILHALDPRSNTLQLVDEAVVLDEQSALFFAGHVTAAERRADWHAHFMDNAGDVPQLCRQLLAGDDGFVAASRTLAERLYQQMLPRANSITPGDFVAVIYVRIGETTPRVALLKLDPDHRLERVFSRVGGHLRVSIRAAENLLPETVRLQKCALLQPRGDEFDVTLLDTQAGPRSDGVAAFFYRGFLTVGLAPSARRHTRLFVTASDTWLARYERQLSPQQVLTFYRARRAALAGESIRLRTFVDAALPDSPALADELLAALRSAILEPDAPDTFEVDRGTADPLVRYITLELDGGARLRLEADRFDELVRVGSRGADGKIMITLNTLTLREVSGS